MKGTPLKILLVAFLFRLILLLIDNYWFRLPQGGDDTERFDRWAYDIYLGNVPDFSAIISSGVTLFSLFGSLLYEIFGHVPIIWGFSMVLFGVGTVANSYKIALVITDSTLVASRVAWLVCLFPNIAILSALVLREAPIHFFLSYSILYLLKFTKKSELKFLFVFFITALIASILHTAVLAVFMGFGMGIVFFNNKISLFLKAFVLILTLGAIYGINATGIGLSKFGGSLESAYETLGEGYGARESGAVYPDWLLMTGGFSDLWKLPIRFLAFLFAPFIPFMVKNANHALGLIDALFYFTLLYFAFRKRIIIFKVQSLGTVACIIFAISLAFSLGASNFGTNIRHRAKIFPLVAVVGMICISHKKRALPPTKV